MEMNELWGIRTDHFQRQIGGPFEPEITRDLVATFTLEEDALKYVKKSELKGDRHVDIQRGMYRFRKESLLRMYDDYEICTHHENPRVAHNPTLKVK